MGIVVVRQTFIASCIISTFTTSLKQNLTFFAGVVLINSISLLASYALLFGDTVQTGWNERIAAGAIAFIVDEVALLALSAFFLTATQFAFGDETVALLAEALVRKVVLITLIARIFSTA